MSSTSASSNQKQPILTKIPLLCRIFQFVKSSGSTELTTKIASLTRVTSSWRDAIVSYSAAVPSWTFGIKFGVKTSCIERLYFSACKRGILWMVESLILAGIDRMTLRAQYRKVKNLGIHLVLHNVSAQHYTQERQAVLETMLNPEIVPAISNHRKRREKISHGPKIDPLLLMLARNDKNMSAFDYAIESGLEDAVDLMLKIFVERKLKQQEQPQQGGGEKNLLDADVNSGGFRRQGFLYSSRGRSRPLGGGVGAGRGRGGGAGGGGRGGRGGAPQQQQATTPGDAAGGDETQSAHFINVYKMNPLVRLLAKGAVSKPHQRIFKKLIDNEYFCDLNVLHYQDEARLSLLHHAARSHNAEACELLLQKEAELLLLKNKNGNDQQEQQPSTADNNHNNTKKNPPGALVASSSNNNNRKLPQNTSETIIKPRVPSYPGEEVYAQKDALLFMQDEHFELPLMTIFSGPPKEIRYSEASGFILPRLPIHKLVGRRQNTLHATVESDDELGRVFATFRVLANAYKKNREKFPDAAKKFLYPNRLPGISRIDTNASIVVGALDLVRFASPQDTKFEDTVLCKTLKFLATEPQKLGFDQIDINEYDNHCRNAFAFALASLANTSYFYDAIRLLIGDFGAHVNDIYVDLPYSRDTYFHDSFPDDNKEIDYFVDPSQNSISKNITFTEEQPRPLFFIVKALSPTLLESIDPEKAKKLGTLLTEASSYGDTLTFLIELGADPIGCNPVNKRRPIHSACFEGYQHSLFDAISAALDKIIAEKAKNEEEEKALRKEFYECQNAKGWTPLMCATQSGSFTQAQALVKKYKVDVNTVNNEGQNAFHLYYSQGSSRAHPMFELLGRAGCDVELKDRKGKTPTDLGLGFAIAQDRVSQVIEKVKKLKQEGNP